MSSPVQISLLVVCLPRRIVAVIMVGTRASWDDNEGSGSDRDASIANKHTIGATSGAAGAAWLLRLPPFISGGLLHDRRGRLITAPVTIRRVVATLRWTGGWECHL